MWVFGYGSLVWKVDFPYHYKLHGYIKGFVRRFWQGSVDHRGVPGKPGRVVTLVPSSDPQEQVWGIAYKIAEDQVETVKKHLDFREKDGYELTRVMFHPSEETSEEPFYLELYVGQESNPFYLGPAHTDEIAHQIFCAEGLSGKNTEYLLNLAATMRAIAPGHIDTHLYDIEKQVLTLMQETKTFVV